MDNYQGDKRNSRVLKELKTSFPHVPVVILQNIDDSRLIADAIEFGSEIGEAFETLYLWALTKSRIRELVFAYVQGMDDLDEALVTKKVTDDIDALNIHRTPLNCLELVSQPLQPSAKPAVSRVMKPLLMILKLAEQVFDESPVNRTEMIGRVLTLLFFQFDKIPRYATRPDLKDCEYALGYFCEWLLRSGRTGFSKGEFYEKVQEYCKKQLVNLEVDVLFVFLATENIFVRRGLEFEFRFSYWLYFFAAHRMHHDPSFAEFVLNDGRYSAYPELIDSFMPVSTEDVLMQLPGLPMICAE